MDSNFSKIILTGGPCTGKTMLRDFLISQGLDPNVIVTTNERIKTGEIEILVSSLTILNKSLTILGFCNSVFSVISLIRFVILPIRFVISAEIVVLS